VIPRGHYVGKRLGDPPADEAEHFIRCPACGGWIDCRDLGQVFEHAGPLPHTGLTAMTGGQFEIRIDRMPRSYATERTTMEAARLIKSKNPHSMVEVKDKDKDKDKDLKSGDVTAVAHKPC
jgi:hypothetical protein